MGEREKRRGTVGEILRSGEEEEGAKMEGRDR